MANPSPTGNYAKVFLVTSAPAISVACWAVCGLAQGDADSVTLELHLLDPDPAKCSSYAWKIKANAKRGLQRPARYFHDLADALLRLKLLETTGQPLADSELRQVTSEEFTAALLLWPGLGQGISEISSVSRSEQLKEVLGISDLGDYEVTQQHKG